jgi:hypothetical protein
MAAWAAGGTWAQSSAGIGGCGSMLLAYGHTHFKASPARERLRSGERAAVETAGGRAVGGKPKFSPRRRQPLAVFPSPTPPGP